MMGMMRKDGSIEYAGYLKNKDLEDALSSKIGGVNIGNYRPVTAKEKEQIARTVRAAVQKCHNTLPYPQTPVFVFVFPWFPAGDEKVSFGGVNAMAAYMTMHIFLDLSAYTNKSLKETIAHEWNHLVFYRYHGGKKYTLLDHMVMEGLAECFREEVFYGKPAPWSVALTRGEAKAGYKRLKKFFHSRSSRLRSTALFGSRKFKKWTGYSLGYWIVKSFRKGNSNLTWSEIVKLNPEEIFKKSKFIKRQEV